MQLVPLLHLLSIIRKIKPPLKYITQIHRMPLPPFVNEVLTFAHNPLIYYAFHRRLHSNKKKGEVCRLITESWTEKKSSNWSRRQGGVRELTLILLVAVAIGGMHFRWGLSILCQSPYFQQFFIRSQGGRWCHLCPTRPKWKKINKFNQYVKKFGSENRISFF